MYSSYRQYKNGLGLTGDDSSWTPDWTIIGSIPNSDVVLLQSPVPEGVGFVVMQAYGTAAEKKLFPTSRRPSAGGTSYSLNADEAFNQFQEISIEVNRLVSSGSSGMPQTFQELDALLMAETKLPDDITRELQRKGKSADGSRKFALDLETSIRASLPIVGNKNAMELAKMYYASYDLDSRVRALQDCNINVLSNYMDPEVISQLIARNRSLIEMYRKLRASGDAYGTSLESFMSRVGTDNAEPLPIMPQDPLFAISIRFEDQNGNEVRLPYQIGVRGSINFDEARQTTQMGANPGEFGSGQTLKQSMDYDSETIGINEGYGREEWKGQSLNDRPQHFLYAYKATGPEQNGRFPWPRGNVKISVLTPNVLDKEDWEMNRLFSYNKPATTTQRRSGEITKAKPLQVLYSENFRIQDGSYQRLTVTIPVFIEPLPMHLIESPPGSGQLKLKWELEPDMELIPEHQKVKLNLAVVRPKANDGWEQADKIPPTGRTGYNDKVLQYDEFVSPAGRAAANAGVIGSRAVTGMRFFIKPDASNTWAASQTITSVESDSVTGRVTAKLCPGEYSLIRLQDINSNGTSALIESSAEYATPFEKLPAAVRSSLTARYDGEPPTGKSFAPKEYPMARFRVPGGFYYRKTDERDTTPIGVVGAEMLERKDLSSGRFARLTNFELNASFPPLPEGKEAITDSIYATLGLVYPETETQGWPLANESTKTTELLFDTASVVLMDDSTVDLSRVGEFERRYEAERDGSSVLTPPPLMPRVGERIAYKGFYIERAYFDPSYGIKPKTKQVVGGLIMSPRYDQLSPKYPHDYDMGRLDSAYNAPGVIDVVGFYPMSGQLSRKLVLPSKMNKGPLDAISAKSKFILPSTDVKRLISLDAMTIPIKASLEGGILTGRFFGLEDIGAGKLFMPTQEAMNRILEAIDAGGNPPANGQNYKQFWQRTEDWFFHAPERISQNELIKGDSIINIGKEQVSASNMRNQTNSPPEKIDASQFKDIGTGSGAGGMKAFPGGGGSFQIRGTNVKIENAADEDILYPPMPYSDEDDTNNSMGMVSW